MNEQALRPLRFAAAAFVIGGVLAAALPQHGISIIQLTIVTVAAGAGLYSVVVNSPPTWWRSPFDRTIAIGKRRHGSGELKWLRTMLSGRRQRIANATPLPAETLRLLQPLIEVALERQGFDPLDEADRDVARQVLSPLAWAVLTSDPLPRPTWYRTTRRNTAATAGVVHRVLDDLDRLTAGEKPRR